MDRITVVFRRVVDQPFKLVSVLLITIYRYSLSMFTGRSCRHLPTCSEYMRDAIWRFGFWPGGWMGAGRVWRCRPGGTHGYDPVPEAVPADSRWWRPWEYGRWQ